MDEVAFVESLFQPELRSTPQPSPSSDISGSNRRSLLISASFVPSDPPASPPSPWYAMSSSPSRLRAKSSLPSSSMQSSGTASGASASHSHSTSNTALRVGVGVGPEEEEVFRQLLNEHEFDESLSMPAQIDPMVDHLQSIEPLDLPKSHFSGGGASSHGSGPSTPGMLFDPAFKDVFLNMASSPLVVSPMVGYGMPQYPKMFSGMGHHLTPRGLALQDPHHTPRHNSLYNDSLIPVQPISQGATPSSSMNGTQIQTLHQAIWNSYATAASNGTRLQLNPNANNIKHMAMTTSVPRNATAPSPPTSTTGAPSPAQPMWLPTMLLTPTATMQPAPDLTRNISSKKSKARKPAKSAAKPSTSSTALAMSLDHESPAKKQPRARKATKQPAPLVVAVAPASELSQQSESDDGQAKNSKGKKCVEAGCTRRAQSNSRCKAHGGGARCQYAGPGGCTRSSQGGGFCRSHGGGKRCEVDGCTRGQQRKGLCYVHGGIRKCQAGDCDKKDRGNGFCISHGGGKRCVFPSCSRSVRRGNLCQIHEDSAS